MEEFYYAQIGPDGACHAVTQAAGPIEASHMIRVDSFDESLLRKRWNGESWEDVPAPTPQETPRETTEADTEPADSVKTVD